MVCIYVLVDMAHNTEVRRHTKLLAGHYVAIGILRELDQRIGHVGEQNRFSGAVHAHEHKRLGVPSALNGNVSSSDLMGPSFSMSMSVRYIQIPFGGRLGRGGSRSEGPMSPRPELSEIFIVRLPEPAMLNGANALSTTRGILPQHAISAGGCHQTLV